MENEAEYKRFDKAACRQLIESILSFGMSQVALAALTGMSESVISKVRNGHRPLTLQQYLECQRVESKLRITKSGLGEEEVLSEPAIDFDRINDWAEVARRDILSLRPGDSAGRDAACTHILATLVRESSVIGVRVGAIYEVNDADELELRAQFAGLSGDQNRGEFRSILRPGATEAAGLTAIPRPLNQNARSFVRRYEPNAAVRSLLLEEVAESCVLDPSQRCFSEETPAEGEDAAQFEIAAPVRGPLGFEGLVFVLAGRSVDSSATALAARSSASISRLFCVFSGLIRLLWLASPSVHLRLATVSRMTDGEHPYSYARPRRPGVADDVVETLGEYLGVLEVALNSSLRRIRLVDGSGEDASSLLVALDFWAFDVPWSRFVAMRSRDGGETFRLSAAAERTESESYPGLRLGDVFRDKRREFFCPKPFGRSREILLSGCPWLVTSPSRSPERCISFGGYLGLPLEVKLQSPVCDETSRGGVATHVCGVFFLRFRHVESRALDFSMANLLERSLHVVCEATKLYSPQRITSPAARVGGSQEGPPVVVVSSK
jgi:hypothetical protein